MIENTAALPAPASGDTPAGGDQATPEQTKPVQANSEAEGVSQSDDANGVVEELEEVGEEDLPKGVKELQKRVNRLTAQKHAHLAQIQDLNHRLQGLQQSRLKAPEEYESDLDYQRDAIRDTFRETQAEEVALARQAQMQEIDRVTDHVIAAQIDALKQSVPDADIVYDESLPISPVMKHLISEADNGAQILYHLAKNPKEAQRLYDLSDPEGRQFNMTAVAREIGRLESRLRPPVVKRQSSAPKPVQTVTGGSNPAAFDPNSATMEDYAKWYGQRGKGR